MILYYYGSNHSCFRNPLPVESGKSVPVAGGGGTRKTHQFFWGGCKVLSGLEIPRNAFVLSNSRCGYVYGNPTDCYDIRGICQL